MMKFHSIKGISFTLAIGRFAKPHIEQGDYYIRLCLGWPTFTFYTLDIDEMITHLIQAKKVAEITPNRAARRRK